MTTYTINIPDNLTDFFETFANKLNFKFKKEESLYEFSDEMLSEFNERLDAYKKGNDKGVSWEQVKQNMEKYIDEKKEV